MGGGTIYYNLTLIPFTKRFESSENLVNLLESRGLQICDRNKAIQYLDNIGYYRLSAYMYPLLKMPKTAHLYKINHAKRGLQSALCGGAKSDEVWARP